MLRYVPLVSMMSLVLAFGCGGRETGTSAGTSGSAQAGAGANAGASVGGSTRSNAGASTGYGTPQDCAAAGGQCVIGGGGGLCAREGPANTCNCNPGCNPGGAICCLALVNAADASTVGDARIPLYHRAAHASCPSQRGSGGPDLQQVCPTPPPPTTVCCSSDAQCDGNNGRCLNFGHAGQQCTYDECFTDSNCPSGAPCICRSSPTDNTANVCEPGGNCVVDSDCSGRYCSPSPSPAEEECGGTSPYLFPYYCHTAMDTCVDDSDCFVDGRGPFFCVYEPQARHWACSSPPAPDCPP